MHPTQNQADPVEVTPAVILRGAAVYLNLYGWTQDRYYFNPSDIDDLFPAACALGAIGMAVYGREIEIPDDEELDGFDDFNRARLVLRGYLTSTDQIVDLADDTVGEWNDFRDQSIEVVIATLNAAATDWDRAHGGAR